MKFELSLLANVEPSTDASFDWHAINDAPQFTGSNWKVLRCRVFLISFRLHINSLRRSIYVAYLDIGMGLSEQGAPCTPVNADGVVDQKIVFPESLRALDLKIKTSCFTENRHISVASNSALALFTGSVTALPDHNNELRPFALSYVTEAVCACLDKVLFFTDEDKISVEGIMNNDIEVITPTLSDEMVSIAIQPRVGAVSANFLYSGDTLQHGGVIVRLGGVAGHSHKDSNRFASGYFFRPPLRRSMSTITAACLVIRASAYKELRGLMKDCRSRPTMPPPAFTGEKQGIGTFGLHTLSCITMNRRRADMKTHSRKLTVSTKKWHLSSGAGENLC